MKKQLQNSQTEVASLRKQMKALKVEMKKLQQPRMESVEEGDDLSESDDDDELKYDEESEDNLMDHDEIDNSSIITIMNPLTLIVLCLM